MSRMMMTHSQSLAAPSSMSSGLEAIARRTTRVSKRVSYTQSGTARRSASLRCSASQGDSKVAVITGANTGLGKISALEMAKEGYSVVLACRSAERAEAAAEDIKNTCKAVGVDPSLDVQLLDLASLASVQDFVSAFKGKYDKCDVLMNNAGVMAPPTRQVTNDGFEMQIGVNHFGHYALTAGMMPSLLSAPEARVVNVSSVAHEFGQINFDNIQSEGLLTYIPTMGWMAYGQSKLANVLFTYELHRRMRAAGIMEVDTNAVHPGVVDTELPRLLPVDFYPIMKRSGLIITPEEGARGQIQLATDPALKGTSGRYWAELTNERKPGEHANRRSSNASYDLATARRLWELSEDLTGAVFDFTVPTPAPAPEPTPVPAPAAVAEATPAEEQEAPTA